MSQAYNIYCDESCHLENDHQKVMVLGATWCPRDKVVEISSRLREIKSKHRLKPGFEIKWTKVSPQKLPFYLDLLDYFFDNSDLHFRGLIAEKVSLQHEKFEQTHDDWYYKMYFNMLKIILSPNGRYRIFLDIKDTRSAGKVRKLHDVLCNSIYDFSREIIEYLQTVRSQEVQILQLTDLLVGAISSINRMASSSAAKLQLIQHISKRSGYSLTRNTLYREEKVNLFHWRGSTL